MDQQPPDGNSLIQFGNGLWLILLGLVGGISAWKTRITRPTEAAPTTVVGLETKTLERLVQSFESTARVLEQTNKAWVEGNEQKLENTQALLENTKVMRVMFERMDEIKRAMNDLVHALQRNTEK